MSLASRRRNRTRAARYEELEPRIHLSSDPLVAAEQNYDQVSPAWFAWASTDPIDRASGQPLSALAPPCSDEGCGNEAPAAGDRWIVRIKPESLAGIQSVAETAPLLNHREVDFRVVRGLGLPGQLLVTTADATREAATAALGSNPHLAYFEPDSMVVAQAERFPSEQDHGEFSAHVGLHNVGQAGGVADADIDAPEAWEITTGRRSVVVAVIDTGVDYTHPDLYRNIWLNQGEIPASIKTRLADVDGDQLVTFVDLNDPRNAAFVTDKNGNAYIDAEDLLQDPAWRNGGDDDHNGFVDDLAGLSFEGEQYRSDPLDDQGHGTHIAGIIAAEGNNADGQQTGVGAVGVNWQSSIMSLKFLDKNNTGTLDDAITAVNYVTMMRATYGVNVRVVNSSWTTRAPSALEQAIRAAGDQGVLVVAGAGNGDAFRNASDNDLIPVYPANYDFDNVISVTATDQNDQLVPYYNFGATTVDLAAPGLEVYSTQMGGGNGYQHGTSFSTAFVSGVAALVLSNPTTPAYVTVEELRKAILSDQSVDPLPDASDRELVATGGRLNALKSLQVDTIAPRATLLRGGDDIVVRGGTSLELEVEYTDNRLVSRSTLNDLDIVVCLRVPDTNCLDDSSPSPLATRLRSVNQPSNAATLAATYEITPPGGAWDHDDNGTYEILLVPQEVTDIAGNAARPLLTSDPNANQPMSLGMFEVEVGLFRVDTLSDTVDVNPGDGFSRDAFGQSSLRAAIMEANAFEGPNTIVLEEGHYRLTRAGAGEDAAFTGDLDITDELTITGAGAEATIIDAGELDRVFDVHTAGTLRLHGLKVTGGVVSTSHAAGDHLGGGGVRNAGSLILQDSIIENNRVDGGFGGGILNFQPTSTAGIFGSEIANNGAARGAGGIYNSAGSVEVVDSKITNNIVTEPLAIGGAIVSLGSGRLDLIRTTVSGHSANEGGGLYSAGAGQVIVSESTIQGNHAKLGAGGGIRLDGGSLLVRESSLYENSAKENGGGLSANGGIVTISTSTLSANKVTGEPQGTGGAVHVEQGEVVISHATITGNRAARGGGVFVGAAGHLRIDHSIVAGNVPAGGAEPAGADGRIEGTVDSRGNNLIGVAFVPVSGTGDSSGTSGAPLDPQLGPLQDNGGLTWTHELLPGSPAIDAGNPSITSGTDQRGAPRPVDADHDGAAVIDIGATERFFGEIHGLLFDDMNNTGVRDQVAGDLEPGIPGWLIYLDLNENGAIDPGEPTTRTLEDDPNTESDEAGRYSFRLLEPRSYVVAAESRDGWQQTSAPANPRPLAVGAIDRQIDFGHRAESGQISGQVFNDLDGDGIKDDSELGIPGWTVFLASASGQRTETRTDDDGNFLFSDLRPGAYAIDGFVEDGWEQTSPSLAREFLSATFSDGNGNADTDGFTVQGDESANLWHLSTRRSADGGHSPGHSFYFGVGEGNNSGTFPAFAAGTLTSPIIDLTETSGTVLLEFNHFLNISKYDTVEIRVLSDDGVTVIAGNDAGNAYLEKLPEQTNGFQPVSLDLSRFAGQRIQVEFDFQADTIVTDSASVTAEVIADPTITYYAEVREFNGGPHSHYSLQLENFSLPIDTFEENDSFDAAKQLDFKADRARNEFTSLNRRLTIDRPGDEDFYRFKPPAPGWAVFHIEFAHAQGDLDLFVYDAPDSLIASASSSTDNEVALDEFGGRVLMVDPSTEYFIRVAGFQDATQPHYDLAIDFFPQETTPDRFEPNSLFDAATDFGTVNVILRERGLSVSSGDEDFYTFELEDNRIVRVETNFIHEFGNVDLFLYDAQRNLIAQSASQDDDESIVQGLPAGQYFVAVRSTDRGYYDLVIDPSLDVNGSNDNYASAPSLGTIGSVKLDNLRLHAGDVDYYPFQVEETGNVTVKVSFEERGDINLALYEKKRSEPDLKLVASSQDEGWYIDDVRVRSLGHYEVRVPPGETLDARDFGNKVARFVGGVGQSGRLTGQVFRDADGNRQRDDGEPGWPGIEVVLYRQQGEMLLPVATAVATDEGLYEFSGLSPAKYQVDVLEPTDSEQTYPVIQSYSGRTELKTAAQPGLPVGPRAVAAADFDQDGTMDIAVANSESDNVSVFLNDGDAGWSASLNSTYSVKAGQCLHQCYPNSLAAGDLDGRGGPDIVATNYNVGIVSILFNDGDGKFSSPVFLNTTDDSLSFVILGQFSDDNADGRIDGDDWVDVAVVGRPFTAPGGHLTIFFNDGSGGFSENQRYDTGDSPSSITSGQFNDDNQDGTIDEFDYPDLAVANFGRKDDWTGSLWVFLNNSERPGEFIQTSDRRFSTGAGSFFLTSGDFDGINGDDVAVANSREPSTVSIHLNDGTGALARSQAPIAISAQPLSVTAVDADQDGDLDLVTSNAVSNQHHSLTILSNDGFGFFPDTGFAALPVADFPGRGYFATAANLDGDQLPDIVMARPFSNDVLVLTNHIEQVPHQIEVKDRTVSGVTFGIQPPIAPGDFNMDGVVNSQDIDLLGTEIAAKRNHVAFDLNADRLVNGTDLELFLGDNLIGSGNKLNGDADFGGDVQFADFVVLAQNFGRSNRKWSEGDFDADGQVQFSDFVILAGNFGRSAALAGAVPLTLDGHLNAKSALVEDIVFAEVAEDEDLFGSEHRVPVRLRQLR